MYADLISDKDRCFAFDQTAMAAAGVPAGQRNSPSRATARLLGHAKSSFWLPLWIRGPGEELRVALSIPLP
jgi:hypothetical protein